ncbi:sensor histidine kinase [Phytoactinopolyspora endophytica]|uniref:sensor histidine kinase n=1 Tax=Phytoactinopolyspora endophytica TaxID=1642495 RepID=UPI00101D2019|nr:sensor histidine kinase [Phytoactinopolyspora endophytica]
MTPDFRSERGPARVPFGWNADSAAAGVITVFVVGVTAHLSITRDEPLDWQAYALIVVAGAAMACCRRWPRGTAVFATLAVGVYVLSGYVNGPIYGTVWLSLLALSRLTDRRTTLAVATPLCITLGLSALWVDGLVMLMVLVGWSAAAIFLGDALRTRRAHLVELEERARYLEHSREEVARRRIAEERLRIARDLHDGVAHAISTINVQAGAASHVIERRPHAAKDALDAIRHASGDVLDELAVMLSVLHDDDGAARAPAPGLGGVQQLADSAESAGIKVEYSMEGPTELVPPAIGTAAYRVVQESLTNVMRHAGAAKVQVTIDVGGDRRMTVDVCDDGGCAPLVPMPKGTGSGIHGMRSRVESTGGRFEAGPKPTGGFRVHAAWEGQS